ncbi:hypothetical protein GA0004736_0471 [Curtobacterium sp. 9128]|uniref:hypothetical protein n=1 Tax=Curtobacterium sp. 9128 TaxID=1793722 RepID=UPI0007D72F91|nr:hypothetical protein [Curtobacterium sp. 9128]SBN61584.1 hypothetical protein GA0004736_0471 [Curtobacterium sp. 9128]
MLDEPSQRRRSPWVVVLTCAVIVLWSIAVAFPTWVLVVIAQLPGEDPGRTHRSIVIALSAFLAFAIPAIGASAGLIALRRHLRSDRSVLRPDRR